MSSDLTDLMVTEVTEPAKIPIRRIQISASSVISLITVIIDTAGLFTGYAQ